MKLADWRCVFTLGIGLTSGIPAAKASIIDTSTMTLVATVDTVGAYDNTGNSYYNGQPLSPSNYPSAYEDQLSAEWDFYVSDSAKNELFIVASNVHDSNFSYLYGTPFYLVPLTGFEFTLQVGRNKSEPKFSNQYAVPGEFLVNGGPSGSNVLLADTPGWSLTSVAGKDRKLSLGIGASDEDDAFTHFTSVYGATRILGGGVFELTYNSSINLLRRANFKSLVATASNGEGAYIEQGTLTYAYSRKEMTAVPEPLVWAMILIGFAGVGCARVFVGSATARKLPRFRSPS